MPYKKLNEDKKDLALVEYAKTGNMSLAAKAVGVSRWTLWNEAKRSAIFRKALDNAKGSYTDALEAILDYRIRKGLEKSDMASATLLIFKLKAEMPDKYRERIDHKVEGDIKIISGVPRPEADCNKTSVAITSASP